MQKREEIISLGMTYAVSEMTVKHRCHISHFQLRLVSRMLNGVIFIQNILYFFFLHSVLTVTVLACKTILLYVVVMANDLLFLYFPLIYLLTISVWLFEIFLSIYKSPKFLDALTTTSTTYYYIYYSQYSFSKHKQHVPICTKQCFRIIL